MQAIKCYDTLTGLYTTVEVTDEIGNFIKRSYWREDMQNRRYVARKVVVNDNIKYDKHIEDEVLDKIIKSAEMEYLMSTLQSLDKRAKSVIYYRYYMEMTQSQIAKQLGVSTSYISKLIKAILCELREYYEELIES